MAVRRRVWQSGGATKTAWVAEYTDQAGKWRLKTFGTKKEADRFLVQTRHDISRGVHTPESTSITVAEAGELWLAQAVIDQLEESSIRQYRQHLYGHIVPLIGTKTLARLTLADIPAFRNALLSAGRSPALTKKIVVSLGAIIAEAMALGKVSRNVVYEQPTTKRKRQRHIESRQRRELKAGVDFPTPKEVNAMLEKVSGRFRPFFITAVFTGMRASELRGLTWDTVDLKGQKVRVEQRASLWGRLGAPKSDAGYRDIPLPPIAVTALREWRFACPKGGLGLVFPNGKGNVENHANLTNRGLDPLQVAAGVVDRDGKPKYGLHALRHFFASMAVEQYPPKRAQAILGHGSIRMTYDIYGHLIPDHEGDQKKSVAIEKAVLGR
jgi:integrase